MDNSLRLTPTGLQIPLSLQSQIFCCLLKELSHLLKIRQGTHLTITQEPYGGKFSLGCHKIAEAKVRGTQDFFTLCYLLSKYVIVSCSTITIWTYFLRGAEEARLLSRRFLHLKKEYKRQQVEEVYQDWEYNWGPCKFSTTQSASTPETILFAFHFLLKKICKRTRDL